MIVGIGTDIARIERFEAGMARHGERFARRLLGEEELARFADHPQPAAFLAKRFAAKEAIAKSLGTGIGVSLSWQDMELQRDSQGAPVVQLTHRARALAESRGGSRVLLTLSDERAYAVAFAVMLA